MATRTIDGWAVTRGMDGDEPVWTLTRDGRTSTVRGQAGISEEAMLEAATASAATANLTAAREDGDAEAEAVAEERLRELDMERRLGRLRAQEAAIRGSGRGEQG